MQTIYIPQYFKPEELVSVALFQRLKMLGKIELVWSLFDWRVLQTLDYLREKYGAFSVNDWSFKKPGSLQHCGFRWVDSQVGAEFSQHKFGRAADCHFPAISADKVRADILKDPFALPFQHITCLEKGVSWLHFDVRSHDKENNGILLVNP